MPHPELSLWQSAVTEVRAKRLAGGNVASPRVLADPCVLATNRHVYERHSAARAGRGLELQHRPWFAEVLELARRVHLGGAADRVEAALAAAGTFSNKDPDFVECVLKFVEWYVLLHRAPQYRDWTKQGGGDVDFGGVRWRLPAGARIGVIGDWGTGLPDARELLERLLAECRPTALIHLGDVYYSGTPREATCNYADILTAAFEAVPPRIPVFNLPGNHDYYSGGHGFYQQLDAMNVGDARQEASYFRLRSEDDRWQLLGVDTGFNDRVPGIAFDTHYTAPSLHDSERDWLRHKLERFPGRTLLFSHHQLFSAHSALNGPRSGRIANFNTDLYRTVEPYLDRIAMWMWGHEHSLALYQDGLKDVSRCRLVGCSAFEIGTDDDPYRVRFADVSYRQPFVRLSKVNGLYSHGFAVIDLGEAAVDYYEFPSWSGTAPESPRAVTQLCREELLPPWDLSKCRDRP
ncbi:MAG TPA: metallophosphoesterase [Candidatus Dormibacteraeota bacterium]